jgi:hypothetical protein
MPAQDLAVGIAADRQIRPFKVYLLHAQGHQRMQETATTTLGSSKASLLFCRVMQDHIAQLESRHQTRSVRMQPAYGNRYTQAA